MAWSDVLGKTAYDHSAWLLANNKFVHSLDLAGTVGRAGWEWRATASLKTMVGALLQRLTSRHWLSNSFRQARLNTMRIW